MAGRVDERDARPRARLDGVRGRRARRALMCCVMRARLARRRRRAMPPGAPPAGRADRVEKARLAVVDVPHDRHDRRARGGGSPRRPRRCRARRRGPTRRRTGRRPARRRRRPRRLAGRRRRRHRAATAVVKLRSPGATTDAPAELLGDLARGRGVDALRDRREDAEVHHELLDDGRGALAERVGELADVDGARRVELDGRDDDLRLRGLGVHEGIGFFLARAPAARRGRRRRRARA